ncbi:VMA21-like domain-containing protein [Parachaetomium inaequale]|uniref:VMA21-like domain-containing protein n=1 Tax=Parachaetomium inaequale TaxID=2588326 RepID=A0AAN6PK81_9PEZI|nr:VMA21-like domain-containing protein [Parachaetomium inaequale]
MATRRIVSQEKTLLEKDDSIGSSPAANEKSSIAPAVPTSVIMKLLAFTLGMIVIPIGSYFVTVDTVFKGNSTYAGALAAIMANVVLIGYIFVAMAEDQSEQQQGGGGAPSSTEGKKDR